MTKIPYTVKNADAKIVSLEAREKMLVEYKDVTVTVYEW